MKAYFNYVSNNKKLKIFYSCVACFLAIFLMFTIFVFAADKATVRCSCGSTHGVISNGAANIAYELAAVVESGSLFTLSATGSDDYPIVDVLTFNIRTNPKFSNLWSLAKSGYNSLLFVGQILTTIYFLLGILDKVFSEKFSTEQFAFELFKYAAMILVLLNGFELITHAIDLAGVMLDKLMDINTSIGKGDPFGETTGNCVYNTYKDLKTQEAIGKIIANIFPYLFLIFAQFLVRMFAWKRILEIVVRVICAPIGMADCVSGGVNSSGVRYIKKILACTIQGVLMYAVAIAYGIAKSVITELSKTGELDAGLILLLVLVAVCITLMQKTETLANEIVGV